MGLDDLFFRRLTNDFQQIVVTQEVESRKLVPFFLWRNEVSTLLQPNGEFNYRQEVVQALLTS